MRIRLLVETVLKKYVNLLHVSSLPFLKETILLNSLTFHSYFSIKKIKPYDCLLFSCAPEITGFVIVIVRLEWIQLRAVSFEFFSLVFILRCEGAGKNAIIWLFLQIIYKNLFLFCVSSKISCIFLYMDIVWVKSNSDWNMVIFAAQWN